MAKTVFVFGSNEAGIHGAGAAQHAYKKNIARWGFSYGHTSTTMGDSFAIPTKDEDLRPLELKWVACYVAGFIAYAYGKRKLKFKITRVGCGLAGFKDEEMARLFKDAPANCEFDSAWEPYLGKARKYWGTFP